MTKFINQTTVFPTETTKEKTVHQQEEIDKHVETETATITVKQITHHIRCETTRKGLGYNEIIKKDAPVWEN